MKGKKRYLIEDFDPLFKKWNKRVYAYAYSKTGSRYLAEETVQRVFIKLWKYLEKEEQTAHIESLIFVIARSSLIDLLRQESGYRNLENNIPIKQHNSDTPYSLYRYKEIQDQLHHLIDQMPYMRRKVFKMSRFENLSHKEISAKLSISTKTVENHITLAIRSLKKQIHFLLIFFLFG